MEWPASSWNCGERLCVAGGPVGRAPKAAICSRRHRRLKQSRADLVPVRFKLPYALAQPCAALRRPPQCLGLARSICCPRGREDTTPSPSLGECDKRAMRDQHSLTNSAQPPSVKTLKEQYFKSIASCSEKKRPCQLEIAMVMLSGAACCNAMPCRVMLVIAVSCCALACALLRRAARRRMCVSGAACQIGWSCDGSSTQQPRLASSTNHLDRAHPQHTGHVEPNSPFRKRRQPARPPWTSQARNVRGTEFLRVANTLFKLEIHALGPQCLVWSGDKEGTLSLRTQSAAANLDILALGCRCDSASELPSARPRSPASEPHGQGPSSYNHMHLA
ncbi:hypothetical protein L1887_57698 [Cichorium endivia]|nr:hypothetical protein L1887_57698 [Cichorium endivia]